MVSFIRIKKILPETNPCKLGVGGKAFNASSRPEFKFLYNKASSSAFLNFLAAVSFSLALFFFVLPALAAMHALSVLLEFIKFSARPNWAAKFIYKN